MSLSSSIIQCQPLSISSYQPKCHPIPANITRVPLNVAKIQDQTLHIFSFQMHHRQIILDFFQWIKNWEPGVAGTLGPLGKLGKVHFMTLGAPAPSLIALSITTLPLLNARRTSLSFFWGGKTFLKISFYNSISRDCIWMKFQGLSFYAWFNDIKTWTDLLFMDTGQYLEQNFDCVCAARLCFRSAHLVNRAPCGKKINITGRLCDCKMHCE